MPLDMSENSFNAPAPDSNTISFREMNISNSTASQPGSIDWSPLQGHVADYVPSQDQSGPCLPGKKNHTRRT